MKLQSQVTQRFDPAELRALAKRSRPPRQLPAYWRSALMGFAVGWLIAFAVRLWL